MKKDLVVEDEVDYSLNDVALRGWVTTVAAQRELPSGDQIGRAHV